MGEKMTNAQAAEILRQHNAWRRGNDDEMPDAPVNPTRLGKAIDHAVAHLTQPAQAVDVGAIERSDVWVVQDEAGHPIHCAGWPQACREHIREAINEHGIEEARAWKVLHYTNGATA